MWKQWQISSPWSKITVPDDCSRENRRRLFLGRKNMTNLNSVLKSKEIILPKKCPYSQRYGLSSVTYECERSQSTKEMMLLNCGGGENSWESLGQQGDQTSQSYRRSILNTHWKDWCWSRISNTLATWCEHLTHWKWPWCWERLRQGEEGNKRGWDGWMASPIQWTWT